MGSISTDVDKCQKRTLSGFKLCFFAAIGALTILQTVSYVSFTADVFLTNKRISDDGLMDLPSARDGKIISNTSGASDIVNPKMLPLLKRFGSPEVAAVRLQDPSWVKRLRYEQIGQKSRREKRIIRWFVKPPPSQKHKQRRKGVDLFLMPSQGRGSLTIDLLLKGKVSKIMGENMSMLGWAKAALALGCRSVFIFESYRDFVNHIDKGSNQMYLMDPVSLSSMKDHLLLDPVLRQRTWLFWWWGSTDFGVQTRLNISEEHGFHSDHVLVAFNFSDFSKAPKENIRMGILPTAVTMNHMLSLFSDDIQEQCDVFYMGKSIENINGSIPLINLVEQKLSNNTIYPQHYRLCSGFEVPDESSVEEILGFQPKYTVNVGRMSPPLFASVVGSAKVVVNSGWPYASPTFIDAIFGGAVFMAPEKAFLSMEMHPLFINMNKTFQSVEEQADKIVSILSDKDRKQLRFGGFTGTSYTIEYTCQQVLGVISKSFVHNMK